ncbi:MAG: hypothetical protein ACOCQ4_01495 [bacterium]
MIVLIMLFVFAGSAYAECRDDERMATIMEVLKQIANDEEIEPLTITPRTYLNTNKAVIERLGDNIVFCPDETPVIGGEPLSKVEADFNVLFRNIVDAVRSKDTERLEMIVGFFEPQEESLKNAISFNSSFGLSESLVKEIYNHFNISYVPDGGNRVQIFEVLGGSVEDENNILMLLDDVRKPDETDVMDMINAEIVIVDERMDEEIREVYKNIGADIKSGQTDWDWLIETYGEDRW